MIDYIITMYDRGDRAGLLSLARELDSGQGAVVAAWRRGMLRRACLGYAQAIGAPDVDGGAYAAKHAEDAASCLHSVTP